MVKLLRPAVVLLIVICGCLSQSVRAETFKIGVLLDLSGPAAYVGRQYQMGAELALEELKAAGEPVSLLFGDHTLSPLKATSEAEKMITIDGVDALFVNGSAPSSAASVIAHKHKKLLVYAGAAVSPAQSNPYAFKTFTDFRAGCRELTKHFQSQGKQHIGVLKSNIEVGEVCLEGVKEVLPQVEVQTYNPGEEVAAQVLRFKNKGTEAIINPAYEADFMNMLKVVSEQNYMVRIGTYIDALTEQVRDRYPNQISQCISFGLPKISPSLIKKIRARYPNWKSGILEGAALTYTHIKQMTYALKSCSKGDTDCQVATLAKSGPDGTIGFRRWNNRIADFALLVKEGFTNK